MYKLVPKHTIKRIENESENKELYIQKLIITLASESDAEEWRKMVHFYINEKEILSSEEGTKIKKDLERMVRGI